MPSIDTSRLAASLLPATVASHGFTTNDKYEDYVFAVANRLLSYRHMTKGPLPWQVLKDGQPLTVDDSKLDICDFGGHLDVYAYNNEVFFAHKKSYSWGKVSAAEFEKLLELGHTAASMP